MTSPRPTTPRCVTIALAVVLFVACDGASVARDELVEGMENRSVKSAPSPAPAGDGAGIGLSAQVANAPAPAAQSADPMLIRTGDARVRVDSLEPAVERVRQLAAGVGGMISNSAISTGDRQFREATLVLKVPAARFDEAMGGLRPIGRLEGMSVQTVDVGEEFVDITARLEAARQLERRLLEILRTRTGDLEDVLAVERELARVRAEIERFEGRLRYLSGRVDMSQITVNLHEPAPLVAGSPGEHVLGAALRQAWRNFVALLAGTIAALGFLLPLAIVLTAVLLAARRFRSRSRALAAVKS